MRWVNPSIATMSPSLRLSSTAWASERMAAIQLPRTQGDFYVLSDSEGEFHAFQARPGATEQARADGTRPGFWSLFKALSRVRFRSELFPVFASYDPWSAPSSTTNICKFAG